MCIGFEFYSIATKLMNMMSVPIFIIGICLDMQFGCECILEMSTTSIIKSLL